MGLSATLDLEARRPNSVQSALNRLAATRLASKFLSRALRPSDRIALRITGGRTTLTGWIGGLPVIWLSVAGRRSGAVRRVPLLAVPYDDDIAVIGSNYGSQSHPSWALNLEASQTAELEAGGSSVIVRSRIADGPEAEEIWDLAANLYPGYARYRDWSRGRPIKVFVFEAV